MPEVLLKKSWNAFQWMRPSIHPEGSAREYARCYSWAAGSLGCSCWTVKAWVSLVTSLPYSEPAWSRGKSVGFHDSFLTGSVTSFLIVGTPYVLAIIMNIYRWPNVANIKALASSPLLLTVHSQISCIFITWEFVSNADSQAIPQNR